MALLWQESDGGIFEIPPVSALKRSRDYLRARVALLAAEATDGVSVKYDDDFSLIPYPVNLHGYLWMSAAESVRERHRFRRCERCGLWMSVQRLGARFCSASCRNFRDAS